MAAMSLRLAVAARNPMSVKAAVRRSKWMPSARRSVVNKYRLRPEAITAASSPMPRTIRALVVAYRFLSARIRSNSRIVETGLSADREGHANAAGGEACGGAADRACAVCSARLDFSMRGTGFGDSCGDCGRPAFFFTGVFAARPTFITSSIVSANTSWMPLRMCLGISSRSFLLRFGRITVVNFARLAAKDFFLQSPDWQHASPQCDFTGHRQIAARRHLRHRRRDGGGHRDAGGGPVFGNGAGRHMDVQILLGEHVGLMPRVFSRERT